MKYLDNVDLTQNQLLNVTLQNLASAPGSPTVGQIYYDTTLNMERVWNGTSWAGADATKSTQLASTISNLASTVQAYTLNQFAAPTGNLNMNSFNIQNLATPILGTDATTKAYVDNSTQSSAAGIVSKQAVAVVSITNLTLSGLSAIDGITPVAGNRILCTGQTTQSANGVWIAASGAWTRSTNDANGEQDLGATWFVEQGTVYGASTWRLATPVTGTITLNTTAVTITQLLAAASYTASLGAKLVGSNIEAAYGAGLTLSGNNLIADPTVVPMKYSVTIGNGSTTSFALTHSLNTLNIMVVVRLISTGEQVICDNLATGANTCSVNFAVAPASNSYQVTIFG